MWGLVLLLVVLHQDFWLWDDSDLVFGFLPVTLLYHACISLAAGVVWYLATLWAWPIDPDAAKRIVPASERPIPEERPVPKEKTNWRQGGRGRDVNEGAPA